jgi:nicotinamide phosphoribosyltransferase
MVLFGLQDFVRTYLMYKITERDVLRSAEFMNRANSFGGALPFNKDMWMSVVEDCDGYLPINISAVPDGTTFFPNQPIIQVVSTKNGFGELAAHIEALMVGKVSIATARATICAHWKRKIKTILRDVYKYDEDTVNSLAEWFIHDFGMRASSSGEESETLGKAHLLFFNGTDTFNAAFAAWRDSGYADVPYGTSIMALAHRNVQGYYYNKSNDTENECFATLANLSRQYGKIGSYVSDCYNFPKAVDKLDALKRANDDLIIVSRPDSGKAKDNIKYILSKEVLRFIEGNSINPDSMFDILLDREIVEKDGPKKGIFGVGGWLRNNSTRDTFSSAMKLSFMSSVEGNVLPVCKLSEDLVKMSVPGYVDIHRPTHENLISVDTNTGRRNKLNRLMVNNGRPTINIMEKFNVIRDRARNDFDSYESFCTDVHDYGLTNDMFCSEINDFRAKLRTEFRGE